MKSYKQFKPLLIQIFSQMRLNDVPFRMPLNKDSDPRRHDNIERTPSHLYHNNQGSLNYQDNNSRRGDFLQMDRVLPNLTDKSLRNMPLKNRMIGPNHDQFRGSRNQSDRFREKESFRNQRSDTPFKNEPFRGPWPNDQRFDGPQPGFTVPDDQFRGQQIQTFMRGPQMLNKQQQPVIEKPFKSLNQIQEPIRPQNSVQELTRQQPSILDGPPVFAVPTTAASKQIPQPRSKYESLSDFSFDCFCHNLG